MLPHLILIVLQLLGAYFITPVIKGYIPTVGRYSGYELDIFIWAILFAVIVFVIGFVGSIRPASSDIGTPLRTGPRVRGGGWRSVRTRSG